MTTPADNQQRIESLEAQIQQIRNTRYPNDPFAAKNDAEIRNLRAQQTALKEQNATQAPNNPSTDAYVGTDPNTGQGRYTNAETGVDYLGPAKEIPQTQVTTQQNAADIATATARGNEGSVKNTTIGSASVDADLAQLEAKKSALQKELDPIENELASLREQRSKQRAGGDEEGAQFLTGLIEQAEAKQDQVNTQISQITSQQARLEGEPSQANVDNTLVQVNTVTNQTAQPNQSTAESSSTDSAVQETGGYFGTAGEADENIAPSLAEPVASYTTSYNPETGLYDVYNLDTGQVERAGLSEQQAQLEAEDLSAGTEPGENERFNAGTEGVDDTGGYFGTPEGAEDETTAGEEEGTITEFTATGQRTVTSGELETLRQAQALQQLRAKSTNEDWRLRISLAPSANYLYKGPSPGIMQPLLGTRGVVFPYTPQITTNYRANYDAYELVHTNYKGYFYKNSSVQEINVTGTFTANSAAEADYLLAVIHFFRSASKMFYGQDSNPIAGTPPPVLYMDGLGVYQFNEHPCLLSSFNYNLPSDVDYVRAGGARNYSGGAVNLASIRNQQGAASNSVLDSTLSRLSSLKNTFDNFINPGAKANNPVARNTTNYYGITGQPTYVPTKIQIQIVLLPLVGRAQQAQSFSLKNYATGQGLREQGFF